MKRFCFLLVFVLALVVVLVLGGCAHAPGPTSIAGGECKFLERPAYAVRGAQRYDQDWIDSTVEGGVGACHWPRPAPRPASLDAQIPVKAKPAAQKKPGWLSLLHGFRKKPVVAAPAEPAPVVEAAPAPEPEPPAPAAKRPIDDLLGSLSK